MPSVLPRTHGGVSWQALGTMKAGASSPYARGCFSDYGGGEMSEVFFPVRTGVFPTVIWAEFWRHFLPRTHGDVSMGIKGSLAGTSSSPYVRGVSNLLVTVTIDNSNKVTVFSGETNRFLKPEQTTNNSRNSSINK